MNIYHYLPGRTFSFFISIIISLLLLTCCQSVGQDKKSQGATPLIRINQLGFYPLAPKIAVLDSGSAQQFYILSSNLEDTLFRGRLSQRLTSPYSENTTQVADFSGFTQKGSYVMLIPGIGHSYPFRIEENMLEEVADASLKAFYYIRASLPIEEAYAGPWARAAGHPDNQVEVHPSAATLERPTATVISASGGWYDAGDYNKYIVNSGITTYTLLTLYEDFPSYFDTLQLNIPESDNELPDLLDESLWNLRWMLQMQDPHDGGVYHKLTSSDFEGMVMPSEAKKQRYVIQKSTAATLDFAAVMAQAARIFRPFESELPGLSDSMANASLSAWDWARQHPNHIYEQNKLNDTFDPDITTGAYGDQRVEDEFIWAASELYITTQADSFYTAVNLFPDDAMPIPSWNQVRILGYYSLARHQDQLGQQAQQAMPQLRERIINLADELIEGVENQPFHTVMGKKAADFNWGSSANAANQGIALVQAFQHSGEPAYLKYALHNVDYLLGRNATGYSFVTGFGESTPMHPHHRPSIADDVAAPVPGLLSGGPNARAPQQDQCESYKSLAPEATFTDDACSYASNEIAINWNAPLAYLLYAIEILKVEAGFVGKG